MNEKDMREMLGGLKISANKFSTPIVEENDVVKIVSTNGIVFTNKQTLKELLKNKVIK